MGEICDSKFHNNISTNFTKDFIEIPSCAKVVIFINEFALLSTNLPFYEVKKAF